MGENTLSGMVFDYNSRGFPLAKSESKIVMIKGYTTAHKTPIGEVAEYIITESRSNVDIAKIVNEVPSRTLGTISAYSRTNGQSLMDWRGRIMIVTGYIDPPSIGVDVNYRIVSARKNYDIVWMLDKDDAIGKTLEVLAQRSDIIDFASSREKDFFLDTLKEMEHNYSQGYPGLSLINLESLYRTIDRRLIGHNINDIRRYDIINGFRFIKMMISESYKKGTVHSK